MLDALSKKIFDVGAKTIQATKQLRLKINFPVLDIARYDFDNTQSLLTLAEALALYRIKIEDYFLDYKLVGSRDYYHSCLLSTKNECIKEVKGKFNDHLQKTRDEYLKLIPKITTELAKPQGAKIDLSHIKCVSKNYFNLILGLLTTLIKNKYKECQELGTEFKNIEIILPHHRNTDATDSLLNFFENLKRIPIADKITGIETNSIITPKTIDWIFDNMPNLRRLGFPKAKLDKPEMEIICRRLTERQITHLNLESYERKPRVYKWSDAPEPKIHSINCQNSLTTNGIKRILQLIATNPNLKEVNINNTTTGNKGLDPKTIKKANPEVIITGIPIGNINAQDFLKQDEINHIFQQLSGKKGIRQIAQIIIREKEELMESDDETIKKLIKHILKNSHFPLFYAQNLILNLQDVLGKSQLDEKDILFFKKFIATIGEIKTGNFIKHSIAKHLFLPKIKDEVDRILSDLSTAAEELKPANTLEEEYIKDSVAKILNIHNHLKNLNLETLTRTELKSLLLRKIKDAAKELQEKQKEIEEKIKEISTKEGDLERYQKLLEVSKNITAKLEKSYDFINSLKLYLYNLDRYKNCSVLEKEDAEKVENFLYHKMPKFIRLERVLNDPVMHFYKTRFYKDMEQAGFINLELRELAQKTLQKETEYQINQALNYVFMGIISNYTPKIPFELSYIILEFINENGSESDSSEILDKIILTLENTRNSLDKTITEKVSKYKEHSEGRTDEEKAQEIFYIIFGYISQQIDGKKPHGLIIDQAERILETILNNEPNAADILEKILQTRIILEQALQNTPEDKFQTKAKNIAPFIKQVLEKHQFKRENIKQKASDSDIETREVALVDSFINDIFSRQGFTEGFYRTKGCYLTKDGKQKIHNFFSEIHISDKLKEFMVNHYTLQYNVSIYQKNVFKEIKEIFNTIAKSKAPSPATSLTPKSANAAAPSVKSQINS